MGQNKNTNERTTYFVSSTLGIPLARQNAPPASTVLDPTHQYTHCSHYMKTLHNQAIWSGRRAGENKGDHLVHITAD